MLPRKLRVTRARKVEKTASRAGAAPLSRPAAGTANGTYVAKPSSEVNTFKGRAGKLLGRAGAAKVAKGGRGVGVPRTPEMVVFEGYRASSKAGKAGVKAGGSGKKKGKPRTRSSKRGAAWKASRGRGK